MYEKKIKIKNHLKKAINFELILTIILWLPLAFVYFNLDAFIQISEKLPLTVDVLSLHDRKYGYFAEYFINQNEIVRLKNNHFQSIVAAIFIDFNKINVLIVLSFFLTYSIISAVIFLYKLLDYHLENKITLIILSIILLLFSSPSLSVSYVLWHDSGSPFIFLGYTDKIISTITIILIIQVIINLKEKWIPNNLQNILNVMKDGDCRFLLIIMCLFGVSIQSFSHVLIFVSASLLFLMFKKHFRELFYLTKIYLILFFLCFFIGGFFMSSKFQTSFTPIQPNYVDSGLISNQIYSFKINNNLNIFTHEAPQIKREVYPLKNFNFLKGITISNLFEEIKSKDIDNNSFFKTFTYIFIFIIFYLFFRKRYEENDSDFLLLLFLHIIIGISVYYFFSIKDYPWQMSRFTLLPVFFSFFGTIIMLKKIDKSINLIILLLMIMVFCLTNILFYLDQLFIEKLNFLFEKKHHIMDFFGNCLTYSIFENHLKN
tara:strand:- start:3884 stop:5344 length:1461 start_codon:yes stop_codon:yes gene_type:complete